MNVQKSCSCNEYFRPRTMCFRAEPLLFFKGGLVIFGKDIQGASQIFTMPSRCRVRMNFLTLRSTNSAKKEKITQKMHEIRIKAQHPWGHVSHQHHIEVLLRVLLRILLFSSTPVIYVVPSVCELVCKTAALVLSGSNLEKTTHQWASTMPSFPPPVLQSHHTWPRAETFFPFPNSEITDYNAWAQFVNPNNPSWPHTANHKWPVTCSVIIKQFEELFQHPYFLQ